jgi:outer membrane autotransporter protein
MFRPTGRYRRLAIALVLAALDIGCHTNGATAQCTVSGSSVTLSTGSCTIAPNTTLNGSPAVHATTSAQINTNNVTINPFNGGSTGALAETLGTIVFNPGSSINGNWATGASAQTGGTIIFQSGSAINPAFGGGGTALVANGAGSQIIATGLTVGLNGAGANTGASATNGGTITLNDGTTITFAAGGGSNTGLSASGAGSQIITNGVTLDMPGGGGNDTGVKATGSASVTLNNSTVSVTGNGGGERGLFADGAGSSITGTGTTISVSSPGGPAVGGVLDGGATIALTGGSVATSSSSPPGSYGFLFQAPAGANTLSLNGTTVTSAADAFAVQSGTATINTVGATVTGNPYSGNNGILLSVINGSTATMTSDSSTLTGAITTASGSTSNVKLTDGTLWNMTASSNTTNLTNNDSVINIIAPTGDPTVLASYKTLTVMNYIGAGGQLVLNTYLGADGSPSDQLVVNGGAATGQTNLVVHNTTGPGDQTTADGILVVSTVNGGATASGAFALAGEVRGGAYDYFLFRGGLTGDNPDEWFLRSTFIGPSLPPTTPITLPIPLFTPPLVLPADPPPLTLSPSAPPTLYPIIGPELATYGVVQPVARELGLTTLGTLNQRIGDTMTLAEADSDYSGWTRSDWGRVFGQQIDNSYQAFADPRATGWLGGIQAGLDLWRANYSGHRDAAGVYLAIGQSSVSVDGLVTNAAATGYVMTRTGTLNLNALSVGGYWTHYGPGGWYFDAVAQGTFYTGTAATQYASLPTGGTGVIISLESGYPIKLPFLGPSFVIEPQGQIIWQQVSFSDAFDGEGPVSLGTTLGSTGRLGLRGQWTIPGADDTLWQPYVGVNLWQDWGAEATTTFGPVDQVLLVERATRTEVLAGLTAKLNSRFRLYGEGGYQFVTDPGSDDIRRTGVKGDVGVRYTW